MVYDAKQMRVKLTRVLTNTESILTPSLLGSLTNLTSSDWSVLHIAPSKVWREVDVFQQYYILFKQ